MRIDRDKVFMKCNGRCAYCGEMLKPKFHVDHIIPKIYFTRHILNGYKIPSFLSHLKGYDVNHIDNLLPACGSCNNAKSAFPLEVFRTEILDKIKRLNTHTTNYKIAKRYGLIQEINKPIIFYFETITN